MARDTPEWIGRTDNEAPPVRVKARVFLKGRGQCAQCTKIIYPPEPWGCDHRIALINGGKNQESNLQILCVNCHKSKTAADVANKAEVYAIRKKYLGLRKPKGRPMPGTRRSGIRKRFSGKIEQW